MKGTLFAGSVISLAVTAAWAWTSALTVGPAAPLHLSARHPVASYLALAAAPAGNGWKLFAVVALVFTGCFLVSFRRRARRAGGA
jgi:hypothetical protein